MLSAALPAPYATNAVCTMSLERDEMFTIAPPPAVSTIFGITSFESRNACVTFMRSAFSKKRSLVCSAARGPVPPALLTSTSILPNSAIAAATSRSRLSSLSTSVGTAIARRPRCATSFAVLSMSAGVRAAHTHVGAGLGECERDAAPDALARARHDRDAVRQLEAVEDHFESSAAARPA
jgi:hypothetical protein